ncbi:MAG: Maf family nucleotide pyrophosphatase [Kaistella sp.]|nr:Maf family nucleotide pyrophosphatase [Kaistella sp.]
MKILLASQSPRRKELLRGLGYDFETVPLDCDEIYPETLDVKEIAQYLSELKANAFRKLEKDEILITADTIVAVGNEVLGKPQDAEHAKEMIRKLSGQTHEVYTGITLRTSEKTVSQTDVAFVEIEEVGDEEIDFYIERCKPFDKAGSYGVQEWFGMAKIKKIEGSFYTVMGLPTHLIYQLLRDWE